MEKIYALIAVAAVAILALAAALAVSGSSQPGLSLPAFAMGSSKVSEAYAFASLEPEKLDGINCACGCMQHVHDGRLHKRGLLDCFMKEDGSYEQHASNCDMCINDALEAKQMFAQGMGKEEVKAKIYSKYR